jgi:cob(I)alamin adenosyltransferase
MNTTRPGDSGDSPSNAFSRTRERDEEVCGAGMVPELNHQNHQNHQTTTTVSHDCQHLLNDIQARGIRLSLTKHGGLLAQPQDRLTAPLHLGMVQHYAELVEHLRGEERLFR